MQNLEGGTNRLLAAGASFKEDHYTNALRADSQSRSRSRGRSGERPPVVHSAPVTAYNGQRGDQSKIVQSQGKMIEKLLVKI